MHTVVAQRVSIAGRAQNYLNYLSQLNMLPTLVAVAPPGVFFLRGPSLNMVTDPKPGDGRCNQGLASTSIVKDGIASTALWKGRPFSHPGTVVHVCPSAHMPTR